MTDVLAPLGAHHMKQKKRLSIAPPPRVESDLEDEDTEK